ncbi:MAG TPA: hypothetical protein VFF64_06600 [Candidatus Eremiobacteraceae bacterium]|nr:hypothetical protein [Candidatus Eremiobacteraceae bacterium]
MSFKGLITKAVADEQKIKADIAKAASAVDGVVVKLEADAPEIEAVANVALPGVGNFVPLGLTLLEGVADILDKGDAVAEKNLTDAGLDSSLLASVKAELANIKKLV